MEILTSKSLSEDLRIAVESRLVLKMQIVHATEYINPNWKSL